ncbi:hypothetical protein TAMA11512_01490 [Selenomonas sp. TAMA-11512]|uniref:hypothetical protein n=1 Tax=Selenomonas sp. TAMA-11512 TaxID=3095337 RepID=UPI003092AD5D|nr:hypothetical protein TAMA11512_01490 [Selenomonas sp. TAMA-11512]
MKSKVMETAKTIFSAKNLKLAGIVALLGAVLAGGGAYWHHEQKAAAKARISEARAQMIRVQAEKEGIPLLSENEVRTLVADAVGMDETALTYRRIELTENRARGMEHDDEWDDEEWDDDEWHKGEHRGGDHRNKKDRHERKEHRVDSPMTPQQGTPAPQQTKAAPPAPPAPAPDARHPMAVPAPEAAPTAAVSAAAAPAPNFSLVQPVYRVKCCANTVQYELILDAQSGDVLHCEIDD